MTLCSETQVAYGGAEPVRRRLDDAELAVRRRARPRAARTPIVFTGPPPSASSAAARDRVRAGLDLGEVALGVLVRRAGSTSPGGCRGTAAAGAASRAGRARRAGSRRRPRSTRNSASCSAISRAAVAALRPRLRRVGAAVVLEVELADDRRPLARLGLERLEELGRRAHASPRQRPAGRARAAASRSSRASARRRRRRSRRRASPSASARGPCSRARSCAAPATVACARVRVGRREVREHLAAVDRPAT